MKAGVVKEFGGLFNSPIPPVLALVLAMPAVVLSAPAPDFQTRTELSPPLEDRTAHLERLFDVTAVNTTVVAFDRRGKAVLDLRPEELLVLEDGQPVELLGLDRRRELKKAANSQDGLRTVGGAPLLPANPWQVAIYVSPAVTGRFMLRTLCQRTADVAARLIDLGRVQVVLADPSPRIVTEVGLGPTDLQKALETVVSEAPGRTAIEQIRAAFSRGIAAAAEADARHTASFSSTASFVVKARAAIQRENEIIRSELDRLAVWMQTQPPATRGLLLWMIGDFDFSPAEYYISLIGQIDPYSARIMRSEHTGIDLDAEMRRLAEVALSFGWTVLPVGASRATFIHGAEINGSRKSQQHFGARATNIENQQPTFQSEALALPLTAVAQATGGEFVANAEQMALLLDRVENAYLVAYQVNRPADGLLRPLEIRCSREGVRVRGRRYAVSGSLRGVAATRATRVLAGEEIRGALDMEVDVFNITGAERGMRSGDLDLKADLNELRSVLSAAGLGRMRVTIMVEIEDDTPSVHHRELEIDWDSVGTSWRFSAGMKWPRKATRMAVVVEELVSSLWGASVVPLK
jgi:hypothetical protein